jgi:hypothetical protein
MKRRRMLAVVLAVALTLTVVGTTLAVSLVTLRGVRFDGIFKYGDCTVTTTEFQVEHRFLNRYHVFSTNFGEIGVQGTGCTIPAPAPVGSLDLTMFQGQKFAAIDFFNPLNDQHVIKSFGLMGVPGPSVPFPMQLGANAWRVSNNPVTLCGYGFLYGGNYGAVTPRNDEPQLVIPFRATISGSVHTLEVGVACMPTMPSP